MAPLAIRQQHVQQLVDELERKFVALKLSLSQTEPQRAERLQEALNRAKEMLLQKRMSEVAGLLNQAQLDAAEENQKALLADIRQLLGVLLAESKSGDSAGGELERLNQWHEKIERLTAAQQNLQQHVEGLPASALKSELEKLAQPQSELAGQTAAVQKLMAAQQSSPPGQQAMSAAGQAMQQASQSLTNQNAQQASGQQRDAVRELLAALKEIDDRARELRQQDQAETLSRLAGHFRQMLEQQQKLTARTAELQAKRQAAGGQLSRIERNSVRAIGAAERALTPPESAPEQSESGLAGKAQQAIEMLGDRTNSTLLSLIELLRDDLVRVGGLLSDTLQTDERTAALQRDIESTLEQLAESLQRARQSPPADQENQPNSDSASASGKKAILPTSAELKLLRAAQTQVNRRTGDLKGIQEQADSASGSIESEIQLLARRQAKLVELAAEIIQRQSK